MATTINSAGTPAVIEDGGGYAGQRNEPLLNDEFTTAQAAPLGQIRIAEPGPGRLTVKATPTGAAFSISGGKLVVARNTSGSAYADYGMMLDSVIERQPGLVCYGVVSSSIISGISFGFTSLRTMSDAATATIKVVGANDVRGADGASGLLTSPVFAGSTDYELAVVLRGSGSMAFIRGGAYSGWTLIWVGTRDVTMNLYAQFANFNSAATLDNWIIKRMDSSWWTQWGKCTAVYPVVRTGDSATADANGFQFVTWTPVAAETLEIQFRRLDANNCWILRCAQTGGTIKLYEKVAGVETERDTGKTQTFTAGTPYRIGILHDGATIRTSVETASTNAAKHVYASATAHQTETGAYISGGDSLANWEFWPRVYAGTTLDTLDHPGTPNFPRSNPNRLAWITDLHCGPVAGGIGFLSAEAGRAFANAVNATGPVAVINTGDCGELYGDDVTFYRKHLHNFIEAPHYVLRGNHDEDTDSYTAGTTAFTIFDSIFPEIPYHFTYDWEAARVRFICPHSFMVRPGVAEAGLGEITLSERNWAENELDNLPVGWKAIVMTHYPADPAAGAQIAATKGGTEWLAILAAHAASIVFYGYGHRHAVPYSTTLSGVTHVQGFAGCYVASGLMTSGGFMLMEYDDVANTITLEARFGRSIGLYGNSPRTLFTPMVFNL